MAPTKLLAAVYAAVYEMPAGVASTAEIIFLSPLSTLICKEQGARLSHDHSTSAAQNPADTTQLLAQVFSNMSHQASLDRAL